MLFELCKGKLKGTPREVLNWCLWYGVFVFGLMGAARGLDEGLIGTSASQNKQTFSNIASVVQMGSVLGALVAFYITDKIGRLWATRQLCALWVLGIAIFLAAGTNGSLAMLYIGRLVAGVGIGQTTVVAPTYLAGIAPRAIRGLCVTVFSGCVYMGIMIAYFASWGSSVHISNRNQAQWMVPNSIHIIFAAVIGGLSFFAIESPRWLVKVGNIEKAAINMSRLCNLPVDHVYVMAEVADIQAQLEQEEEAVMGTSWLGPFRELFATPANRYRVHLSLLSQLLAQWSGANSITIYAPEYFAMMGVSGQSEKLFATAIFGLVKLISSLFCATFLIDFVGRKKALCSGIGLQFISMLYMALFLIVDKSIDNKGVIQSLSEKRAAIGAIVMIYSSGFGWALGWNSIQYLINSEIYPLRLRAIGGSLAMTFHFVNQYGNSKAVPTMFLQMTAGGTMFFFSAVTALGFAWVWFFLPETSGKSLESMDELFDLPWYLIGTRSKQLTGGQGSGTLAATCERDGGHAPVVRNIHVEPKRADA